MEQSTNEKQTKLKVPSKLAGTLRVSRDTKRKIAHELAKVNKKAYGKKVKVDALLNRSLSLLTERDVCELQEASLSNSDRLERLYQEHVKQNGATSKDEFLGRILNSQLHQFFPSHIEQAKEKS